MDSKRVERGERLWRTLQDNYANVICALPVPPGQSEAAGWFFTRTWDGLISFVMGEEPTYTTWRTPRLEAMMIAQMLWDSYRTEPSSSSSASVVSVVTCAAARSVYYPSASSWTKEETEQLQKARVFLDPQDDEEFEASCFGMYGGFYLLPADRDDIFRLAILGIVRSDMKRAFNIALINDDIDHTNDRVITDEDFEKAGYPHLREPSFYALQPGPEFVLIWLLLPTLGVREHLDLLVQSHSSSFSQPPGRCIPLYNTSFYAHMRSIPLQVEVALDQAHLVLYQLQLLSRKSEIRGWILAHVGHIQGVAAIVMACLEDFWDLKQTYLDDRVIEFLTLPQDSVGDKRKSISSSDQPTPKRACIASSSS